MKKFYIFNFTLNVSFTEAAQSELIHYLTLTLLK